MRASHARWPNAARLAALASLLMSGCSVSPTASSGASPPASPGVPVGASNTSTTPVLNAPSASAPAPAAPTPATASAAAALTAAYDMEADRAARVQEAKSELGGAARAMRVDPVFVLAGPTAVATSGAAPFIEAVLAAYQNGRFDKAPARAISIYIFPQLGEYHGFCRKKYGHDCISRFGFYEPGERKIIMNGGADGTLSHELVHPFVEADFPDAPTWLNEGIASLYEAPVLYKKGEIRGAKNWRLPRLKQAIAAGATEQSMARIDTLVSMPDAEFRAANEDLHYATARYVCQWLEERGVLWQFYHAFRDGFAEDPTGEKAFSKTVGMTPAQATNPWLRWVRAL